MIALILTASLSQLCGWGLGLPSSGGVKLPLRPPTPGITVPPLSPRYRWRASSALSCPYMEDVDIPLCGQIYDLHLDGAEDGKQVQGRACFLAKDRYVLCTARVNLGMQYCWMPVAYLMHLESASVRTCSGCNEAKCTFNQRKHVDLARSRS